MADDDVVNLLTAWVLKEYIAVFKENAITSFSLALLSSSDIRELIPLIGHRTIFNKNYELWQKTMLPEAAMGNVLVPPDISFALNDILFDDNQLNAAENELPVNSPSTSSLGSSRPSSRSSPASIVLPVTEEQGLQELLNSTLEGKALLTLDKNEPLSNVARLRLVKIIGTHILQENPSRNIVTAVYVKWAREIVGVFPKEKATVYFHNKLVDTGNGVSNRMGGKLPDQIHNLKRKYRESGIIPKRSRSTSSSRSNSPGVPRSPLAIRSLPEVNEIENQYDSIEDDLQWLRNSSEPWQTVEQKWESTTSARLRESINSTIDKYFQDFPALQKPLGYLLLQKDFEVLYPKNTNGLFDNFPLVKEKIIGYARKRSGKDKYLQKLLMNIEDCASEETKNIVCILLIPALMSVSTIRLKGNKKVWRPSKPEVCDGFVTHVSSEADIHQVISERRNKFTEYGLTLQPFVIIVGTNITEIMSYYVIVNNNFYTLSGILAAVDACFKIIWTINAQYAAECTSTWLFFQKGLYKLKSKHDKESTAANTLLADLGIDCLN